MQPIKLLRLSAFRVALATSALPILMLVITIFVAREARVLFSGQTDATIAADARGLREHAEVSGVSGLARIIAERSRTSASEIYVLATPEGQPIAGNLDTWPKVEPDADGYVEFQFDVFDMTALDRIAAGEPAETALAMETRTGRARIIDLGEGYTLLVGRDVGQQQRIEIMMASALWALAIATLLGLIFIAAMMSVAISSRITHLHRICRAVSEGDFRQHYRPTDNGDEIDSLGLSINAMVGTIDRLVSGMRSFQDHVAHELKTPLNRIRSGLEHALIAKPPREDLEAEVRRAIELSDDLAKTFGALLTIVRAETGTVRHSFVAIDLAEIVHDVVDLYEPLADENGLTLAPQVKGRAPVLGNREMLARAAANLIDNAIKYTPRGGRIDVAIVTDETDTAGNAVTLIVRDTGPGVPHEERDRVLERFARLESTRDKAGAGLGLSLVAAIARVHDARLILEDSRPGLANPGLKVMLVFPRRVET